MEPNEIRAEFVRLKKEIKSVAEKLEIAAPSVSQVISGVKKTRYIQEAIAEAIGRPVDKIFPSDT